MNSATKKSEYQKIRSMKQEEKLSLLKRKSGKKPGAEKPLLLVLIPQHPQQKEVFEELQKGIEVLPCEMVTLDASASSATVEQSLKAADMAVLFDEHAAFLPRLLEYGVVPVAHTGSLLLQNYHPNEETGNSFTFDSYNAWDMFRALVRAHETFRFPYDWNNIVRNMVTPKNKSDQLLIE